MHYEFNLVSQTTRGFEAKAETQFLATVPDSFLAGRHHRRLRQGQCPTLVLLATRNIQQA